MIKSVTVTNHINETFKMLLNSPEESGGVIIKSITGLGPQQAIVHISEYTNMDGGVLGSSRLPSREIVFNLELQEHPTVEEVRVGLYRHFPIKKPVLLEFETDLRTYSIVGTVQKNDPDIFQKQETVQIVIKCTDPYFYDNNNNNNNNTWMFKTEPLFQFPFSNESLTDPLIEFSRINKEVELIIKNPGMDEAGGIFKLYFYGEVVNPTIVNVSTNEQFYMQTEIVGDLYGKGFKEGDLVEICTISGKRYATLYRDGREYNVLNSVRRDSKWLQFVRGDNRIMLFADSGIKYLSMEISIIIKYEGI